MKRLTALLLLLLAHVLVVQTQSLAVQSFHLGETEQKVGEIWFYVPEGVKWLTISHQQLGML